MIGHLSASQRHLAEYMSSLSEAAYHAAWMEGLELALWKAIVSGPYKYGRLQLTSEHIERLQMLSNQCEGWVRFENDNEETFVTLEDWREYAANAL
jgi:UV DNA damage repair endonuclease